MLNVEFVTQFAAFAAILAGFSMSIAFAVILRSNSSSNPRVEQLTAGAFLLSALVLMLSVFIAALVLSINAQSANLGQPDSPDQIGRPAAQRLVQAANLTYYLSLIGGLFMMAGLGASGFIRSRKMGRFTATASLAMAALAVVIAVVLLRN